jgi:hypothetical protein
MASKTKIAEPLSATIATHEQEAERHAAAARESRQRAAELAAEKAAREVDAKRAWAEARVSEFRELFQAVSEARARAVGSFKAGRGDAHSAWLAWRAAAMSAQARWSVISRAYNSTHSTAAPRAPGWLGRSAGHSGESWLDFSHRLAIELGNEASAAARKGALGELAEVLGVADLRAVEAGVTPIARFYRGRVVDPGHGFSSSGEVEAWPGRHPSLPVTFSATGHLDVYDPEIAAQLDADDNCARIAVDDDGQGDGDGEVDE